MNFPQALRSFEKPHKNRRMDPITRLALSLLTQGYHDLNRNSHHRNQAQSEQRKYHGYRIQPKLQAPWTKNQAFMINKWPLDTPPHDVGKIVHIYHHLLEHYEEQGRFGVPKLATPLTQIRIKEWPMSGKWPEIGTPPHE